MERGLLANCPFFSVTIVQIFVEVLPNISDYALLGDYKEYPIIKIFELKNFRQLLKHELHFSTFNVSCRQVLYISASHGTLSL